MNELSDNVQQQLYEHILREKIDDLEAREEQYEARIAELEEFIGKLIEAGESEDSPMPAVWLELVNDWKEREG